MKIVMCWMSPKMLDEKFTLDQILIQHDFSSSSMIFLFLLFLDSVKPIQHGIFFMLDKILDRLKKASGKVEYAMYTSLFLIVY